MKKNNTRPRAGPRRSKASRAQNNKHTQAKSNQEESQKKRARAAILHHASYNLNHPVSSFYPHPFPAVLTRVFLFLFFVLNKFLRKRGLTTGEGSKF